MGYWKQFDSFDPLTGEVPYWPFSILTTIAWRARYLLKGRNSQQIRIIVNAASNAIDDFFEQAKEDEIARLVREGDILYLNIDKNGKVQGLDSDREHELDFATSENTRDFEALDNSVGNCSQIFDDDDDDPAVYEYFAAMALLKVADSIYRIKYNFDFKTRKDVRRDKQELGATDIALAGESAIEAMEFVCHATRLRDESRSESRFQQRLEAAEKKISESVLKASERKWKTIQDQEAKQKSDHAKKMAALSKKNRNASMDAVLKVWEGDPAIQNVSNSKAGIRLSKWLESQDLEPFEPRTVTQWISDHKKAKASVNLAKLAVSSAGCTLNISG